MTDLTPRWDPQPADRILLAGDERALDTIALILATLPSATRGQVFVEVASADEVGTLEGPGRVAISWLVRERGQSLQRSVDAWCSEMLPTTAFGHSTVYAWIAAEGPARLLSSN
jgi:NADPH-dependent ferric siderophore reductase